MSSHSDIHVICGNSRGIVAEFLPKIIFKKEREHKIYSLPNVELFFNSFYFSNTGVIQE